MAPMGRGSLSHRLHNGVASVLLALASSIVMLELLLRLFGQASIPVRQLLYLPGQVPELAGVDTLDELVAVAPLPLPPLRIWGGFRLNSHGLYTAEYERTKPIGTVRVVTLGDSFTFDSGMVPPASIWHAQVGTALAGRFGRPVEVVNLGLPAVGPRFAAKMYEVEGRHLAPDLVVLGLFMGNDLTDESGSRAAGLKRWSYAWHAARNLWALRAARRFRRVEAEAAHVFLRSRRAQVTERITDVVQVVAELQAAVTATPARLVVALFPDQLQIDVLHREAILGGAGIAAADFDADGVVAELRDALVARGISVVDVAPALKAAPDAPRLYRRQDVHWTVAGNTVAAAAVLGAVPDLG
jgi:SGNH hydrolase-like domain, acetyltransferase AlgX